MSNKNLGQLIEWLEKQDPNITVKNGFGFPHCDCGNSENLAFEPMPETTFGNMLHYARASRNKTFPGYKTGEYTMHDDVDVCIGHDNEWGENITDTHFLYWEMQAK